MKDDMNIAFRGTQWNGKKTYNQQTTVVELDGEGLISQEMVLVAHAALS